MRRVKNLKRQASNVNGWLSERDEGKMVDSSWFMVGGTEWEECTKSLTPALSPSERERGVAAMAKYAKMVELRTRSLLGIDHGR